MARLVFESSISVTVIFDCFNNVSEMMEIIEYSFSKASFSQS